jgi:hypothetical protein
MSKNKKLIFFLLLFFNNFLCSFHSERSTPKANIKKEQCPILTIFESSIG